MQGQQHSLETSAELLCSGADRGRGLIVFICTGPQAALHSQQAGHVGDSRPQASDCETPPKPGDSKVHFSLQINNIF